MSERRYIYRVRALREPIVHYHGRSFVLASEIFDSAHGSRVMELSVNGEWRDVMSYREWITDITSDCKTICKTRSNSQEQEAS